MILARSALLLVLSAHCAHGDHLPVRTLTVGGHRLRVEVADDPPERSQGLQFRESLGPDEGMLFVYPDEAPRYFWMEYTTIPLSIAFMDSAGRIVHLADMKPLDRTEVPSVAPAMYALEVNQGWFAEHHVQVGATVSGLPPPSER